jgi:hypothetical protein
MGLRLFGGIEFNIVPHGDRLLIASHLVQGVHAELEGIDGTMVVDLKRLVGLKGEILILYIIVIFL